VKRMVWSGGAVASGILLQRYSFAAVFLASAVLQVSYTLCAGRQQCLRIPSVQCRPAYVASQPSNDLFETF
jgi:hypothetical protein